MYPFQVQLYLYWVHLQYLWIEQRDATAERLFVEVGYDAMTMTAVAERAKTSIGALYRWFPDKTAVATALLARYTVEIEQHWAPLIAAAHTLTTAKFAESLIDRTREFSQLGEFRSVDTRMQAP